MRSARQRVLPWRVYPLRVSPPGNTNHPSRGAILLFSALCAHDAWTSTERASTLSCSAVPTYEWWGQPGGAYEEAWEAVTPEGLDGFGTALVDLTASGRYDGVIGFSQGGAVASLIPARWQMLFSSITPPTPTQLQAAGAPPSSPAPRQGSFHCFDEQEEHAALCRKMARRFDEPSTLIVNHTEGHVVATSNAVLEKARAFLEARLSED